MPQGALVAAIWLFNIAFLASLIRLGTLERYRSEALRRVTLLCEQDIAAGRTNWQWRFDGLASAPFVSLIWQPWRSPRAVYTDQPWLR